MGFFHTHCQGVMGFEPDTIGLQIKALSTGLDTVGSSFIF